MSKKRKRSNKQKNSSNIILDNVIMISFALVGVLLFLSLFGFGGKVGEGISHLLFGLFGLCAYIFAPLAAVIGILVYIKRRGATAKSVALVLLFLALCFFTELACGSYSATNTIQSAFDYGLNAHFGGGAVGGIFSFLIRNNLGFVFSILIDVAVIIICGVILTGKSFVSLVSGGSQKVYTSAKDDISRRRDRIRETRQEKALEEEKNRAMRMDKKKVGVTFNTDLKNNAVAEPVQEVTDGAPVVNDPFPVRNDDMEELSFDTEPEPAAPVQVSGPTQDDSYFSNTKVVRVDPNREEFPGDTDVDDPEVTSPEDVYEPEEPAPEIDTAGGVQEDTANTEADAAAAAGLSAEKEAIPQKPAYRLPPLSLLNKPKSASGANSRNTLENNRDKLKNVLKSFGMDVEITGVQEGPTVTRYEILPPTGVKVSRILGLSDDIKLALAAADIRIEAPIPGKSAIGIEVPNENRIAVPLKALLESPDMKNTASKLAFACGRRIDGSIVVSDIAKMPHLLIAGATGSGKSVCINTIIMSLLFRASPEDVKLIMIDPKVVELSVYNGIPHLLTPVVTDPKKATGALSWAVNEMTRRYQAFANLHVRDMKAYNEKIAAEDPSGIKMSQIVIIVDELADLMMVASKEVEDLIVRLTQLARAAGIHLIIATQRPSVNVITGLIKANMPSRIAFSVSSGVDSRTILDGVGAEKLLGNGDMLYLPQGMSKPERVQGTFVSDDEVNKVVNFLREQTPEVTYDDSIAVEPVSTSTGGPDFGDSDGADSDRDELFVRAGQYLIETQKGSIGSLQRKFRIGFNRAARIVDQLEEAGVLGPEEGTKPRQVLMSLEDFERSMSEGS